MKFFLILLLNFPLLSFAQGKFGGGDGSGYSSARRTIQAEGEPVLGISEERTPTVYPNPASTFLFIGNSNKQEIEIFDFKGQSIYAVKQASGKLDISGLKEGIYFIRLSDKIFKFIKK